MRKPLTMKVVGRTGKADPVRDARILQRTGDRLLRHALVPRGVYRFKTHKEADAWMTRMIVRTRVRRTSKTS
ncbi:MAG: hypothetical protein HY696_10300 [Deltaproteobacteria bacterium]|nr:hypothetical protein [Deltaproteobacteria bacterium]